jgi:hypothetical protein
MGKVDRVVRHKWPYTPFVLSASTLLSTGLSKHEPFDKLRANGLQDYRSW